MVKNFKNNWRYWLDFSDPVGWQVRFFALDWVFQWPIPWMASFPEESSEWSTRVFPHTLVTPGQNHYTLRCGRPNLQTPPLSAAVIPIPPFSLCAHTHIPVDIGTLSWNSEAYSFRKPYGTLLTRILIHTLDGLSVNSESPNTYTDIYLTYWENSDWVVSL